MQIISNIALITINETLIIQLISFLIFIFLLNRLMFRPLKSQMEQRDSHIETIKEKTKENKKKLQGMIKLIHDQEATAKKEAFEVTEQLKETGTFQAAEIMEISKNKIIAFKEKVEADVNLQISNARKSIEKEADILARNIMEKALSRRLEL